MRIKTIPIHILRWPGIEAAGKTGKLTLTGNAMHAAVARYRRCKQNRKVYTFRKCDACCGGPVSKMRAKPESRRFPEMRCMLRWPGIEDAGKTGKLTLTGMQCMLRRPGIKGAGKAGKLTLAERRPLRLRFHDRNAPVSAEKFPRYSRQAKRLGFMHRFDTGCQRQTYRQPPQCASKKTLDFLVWIR